MQILVVIIRWQVENSLVNWENLCWLKEAEGMGFRDLRTLNLAMLAKQGWKILQNPDIVLKLFDSK